MTGRDGVVGWRMADTKSEIGRSDNRCFDLILIHRRKHWIHDGVITKQPQGLRLMLGLRLGLRKSRSLTLHGRMCEGLGGSGSRHKSTIMSMSDSKVVESMGGGLWL